MTPDERRAAMDRLASAQRAAARLAEYRRRDAADEMLEADTEARERRASMHAIEGGGDDDER